MRPPRDRAAATHAPPPLLLPSRPENVVISTNGYCQLTDFGISKKLNNEGHVVGTSGTRGYMASASGTARARTQTAAPPKDALLILRW